MAGSRSHQMCKLSRRWTETRALVPKSKMNRAEALQWSQWQTLVHCYHLDCTVISAHQRTLALCVLNQVAQCPYLCQPCMHGVIEKQRSSIGVAVEYREWRAVLSRSITGGREGASAREHAIQTLVRPTTAWKFSKFGIKRNLEKEHYHATEVPLNHPSMARWKLKMQIICTKDIQK